MAEGQRLRASGVRKSRGRSFGSLVSGAAFGLRSTCRPSSRPASSARASRLATRRRKCPKFLSPQLRRFERKCLLIAPLLPPDMRLHCHTLCYRGQSAPGARERRRGLRADAEGDLTERPVRRSEELAVVADVRVTPPQPRPKPRRSPSRTIAASRSRTPRSRGRTRAGRSVSPSGLTALSPMSSAARRSRRWPSAKRRPWVRAPHRLHQASGRHWPAWGRSKSCGCGAIGVICLIAVGRVSRYTRT